jgi:hypothetical protein
MQCFEQVFYEKINMFLMKSFERVILTLLCRVTVIYKNKAGIDTAFGDVRGRIHV